MDTTERESDDITSNFEDADVTGADFDTQKIQEDLRDIARINLRWLATYLHPHNGKKSKGSIKAMAEALGINYSQYSQWVNGNRWPSKRSFDKLTQALKFNVANLFDHDFPSYFKFLKKTRDGDDSVEDGRYRRTIVLPDNVADDFDIKIAKNPENNRQVVVIIEGRPKSEEKPTERA